VNRKIGNTLTGQFNLSTNNSQGQTASFTVVGRSNWAGPAEHNVYQDNLCGTFVVSARSVKQRDGRSNNWARGNGFRFPEPGLYFE
jgi:hypothetical protein